MKFIKWHNEMTVQEKVVQLLLNSGMSPKETIALLEKAKDEMPQMENCWQDNIEGYLPSSLAAIVLAVKGYQDGTKGKHNDDQTD